MAATLYTVEGLSDLLDGLEELPKATGNNVQKRALRIAAAPFLDDAKARAPVRTGYLRDVALVISAKQPKQSTKK